MATYTKTPLDSFRKDNPLGDFIGWDSATHGTLATEARRLEDLDTPVSRQDMVTFCALAPGQKITARGYQFFRV